MSAEATFELHPKQMEVFTSSARFKVGAAGRRGGKSYLAAVTILSEGMKTENDKGYNLKGKDVWYIAPTFNQGKDIIWGLLKDLGSDFISSTVENQGVIRLVNGRRICVKGSDRPETLRGVGLSFVVMDEYADMKPEVWDLIVGPTLADVEGGALFIGTPAGKNHFYEVYKYGMSEDPQYADWESFHWTSIDNPILNAKEIEAARDRMSTSAFRQEHEASFEASGGGSFKESDIIIIDNASTFEGDGMFFTAMDPAGFGSGEGMIKSTLGRLDEHSITTVETGSKGWLIHDITHGRWGVREACLKFLRICQVYRPSAAGIEGGSLKNAMKDYLEDEMRRLGVYPNLVPVTHGGQKKTERILWALQGRFERGRIYLLKGSWNKAFIDQLLDFPNAMAHDDLLDSTAYIDQVATTMHQAWIAEEDYWEPLDPYTGF